MKVGSSKVDITPPLNIPYLGFLPRQGRFKGVHDPLYAKAIVFDNGETSLSIISADSIGFSNDVLGKGRNFTAEVRDKIFSRTGILQEKIMLATTHAHSTPETTGITDLLNVPGADKWLEVLMDQIASAVEMAQSNMCEAQLKFATGEAQGIAKNRRKGNLSIMQQKEQGFLDESVGVLLIEGESRTDIIMNFSCHPVTVQVQPLVSADYPGTAAHIIQNAMGSHGICAFLQGSAGDINPIYDDSRDFNDVEMYGMILAGEVIKLIAKLRYRNRDAMSDKLSSASEVVKLPSRNLPEIEQFINAYNKALEEAKDERLKEQALRMANYYSEIIRRIERGTEPILAELQVFRIGELAIIAIPGELFVSLGLQIKCESPAQHTLISETTNGWIGYIVSPGSYQEGGYEVQPGPWSMTDERGSEIVVKTALDLVRRLWT